MGLRPSEEVELSGLDISEHGEEGYHGEPYPGSRPGVEMPSPKPVLSPAKSPKPAMG
jgi:hypothetical protein